MIRTLHWYLMKELLRVAGLALVALTLLMTIMGIIEPMRKVGLASNQVLALFGYLMPFMLSLTLPVATLFAATIVYGRFSQDNELLAARASGISTITLLRPAIVLGFAVTVLALVLNNYVAPVMLGRAEKAAKKNLEGMFFHQLRTRNTFDKGADVLHADAADADQRLVHGAVVVSAKDPREVRFGMASMAKVVFDRNGGDTWVIVEMLNAMGGNSKDDKSVGRVARFRMDPLNVPNLAEEEPGWYNWNQLVAALRDPAQNRDIARRTDEIRRDIGNDLFLRRLAETIKAKRPFEINAGEQGKYVLSGAEAETGKDASIEIRSAGKGAEEVPVQLKIIRGGQVEQTATGEAATVRSGYSSWEGRSSITIRMENVRVDVAGGDSNTRTEWSPPVIDVPPEVRDLTSALTVDDVLTNGEQWTASKDILKDLNSLREEIPNLERKIKAEMNVRIAYCLSCLLLVSLGAALGLIFRGGHFISAFAIALVPGAILIVLMVMGKEMIRHPDIPAIRGVACIWSGILVLGAANTLVYGHLMRK